MLGTRIDGHELPPRVTDAQDLALREARRLCAHHRADLANGRCPWPGLLGGHTAPCEPKVDYTTKGVAITLQTAEGYEIDHAWHTYWRAHDYDTLDQALLASAPAAPTHDYHATAWFTWARLGRLHRDQLAASQAPQQLRLALD